LEDGLKLKLEKMDKIIKIIFESAMVVHAYNTRKGEVEAGRSQVHGQPGLYRETLSQTKVVFDKHIHSEMIVTNI
jgi:hypothetical protein